MCGVLLGAVSLPGVAGAVGFALSFIIEWWPAWETTVPARIKRIIMLLLCLGIGFGLYGLGVAFGCAEATTEGAWAALLAGFAAFSTNQIAHLRTLAPTKVAEVEQAVATIEASDVPVAEVIEKLKETK